MSSFLIESKQKKTLEDKISTRSLRTQEIFKTAQKSFETFCNEYYEGRTSDDLFDELSKIPKNEQNDVVFDIFQNWIDWNYQKNILTSTLKVYFSKLKVIFHHKGFRIHPQDIRDNLVWKKKIREELHALQIEEIQKIFSVAKPQKLGFYLALISTGARPGELLQSKKRDFDTSNSRVKITIHPEGAKTRAGRSVYLTTEASNHILPILENLDDDDLVFTKLHNPSNAEKTESKTFSRYCDIAGFTERYHSNNYRKITLYSFRSFFYGKCADIHREGYAHKMIGHGGYLPQYDRMSDEQKIAWFVKVEPQLTVDQSEKYKLELEATLKESSSTKEEVRKLTKMVQRLQNSVPRSIP